MKPPPKDLVASIQARLLQHSRTLGVDHQLTLVRFAGERLLYRLAACEYAGKFILKGAALMLLWLGEKIRPTRDIDLLGSGDTSAEELKHVFTALCEQRVAGDGIDFLAQTVQVEAIREQQDYGGMRVTLTRSVFERDNIVSECDLVEAAKKLNQLDGHNLGTVTRRSKSRLALSL